MSQSASSVFDYASLLAIGSALLGAVGSALKWYFDRKERQMEIFKQTFEKFSQLTAQYYLPMAVEGGRAGRLLRTLFAPKPPEPQYVFFNLSRFQMYVRRYVQSGGGYLMPNLKDERIQANLYFRAFIQMPFTDTDIAVMQDAAEGCNRYILFKKKLEHPDPNAEGEPELKKAYDKFVKWIKDKPNNVKSSGQYLQHYRDYIMKNITGLYSGWYTKTSLSESNKEAVKRIQKQIEKTEHKVKTELKETGLATGKPKKKTTKSPKKIIFFKK
ncbi:MAG: hypothetical protein WED07_16030 [Candidatus Freyarchaeum deiterrae]